MKPIRVMQIISGFAVEGPLGGIERFGIELSRSITQTSTEIDNTLVGLWSYDQPAESNWMREAGVGGSHVWMGPSYNFDAPYQSFLECYRAFLDHFAGQRFDVIHSHCQFGDLMALAVARQLGAKVKLRTVHNEREWWHKPIRRLLLTNLLYPLLFRGEVGVSQRVVDNLDGRFVAKLTKRHATRIYNAVNLSRFIRPSQITDLRSQYQIPQHAYVIGSVGRLTEQKGYRDLIDAAKDVISQHPDTYFMIVGDGELRVELDRQINDSGLSGRVILTGALRNIEMVLWNWDLFVSSSLWEGLPTVILESMAAGVPVVATEVSGTVELVQHRANGLLVPPNRPDALAESILCMIDDRGLGTALSASAAETVRGFSINTIAQKYEELYFRYTNRL